ncbi:MAG: cold-shock protein [Alphaproteobacteria bacterium]|nr:cold-shock protein [Alphaproteobacteria bacterium]
MATGTIKWFNSFKGVGYIHPDEGGDVFVLFTKKVAEEAEEFLLVEGSRVEFEIIKDSKGRNCAKTIKAIDNNEERWRDINSAL